MGSGLEQGSVFHLQGNLIDPAELASRADLLGTTSPNVLLYAGIDAWRRQMVQHGHELIGRALELAARTRTAIETIDGFHVNDAADFCGPGLAADFDPLPVVMDIGELGTSGYRAADWLRENHHIDVHLFDHRRISAQLTHADDEQTTARLLTALRGLAGHATGLRDAPPDRRTVPGRSANGSGTAAPRRLFHAAYDGSGHGGLRQGCRRDDHPLPARHPCRPAG
jgi:arginine decarboxylase